jgi:hypothetical protein
MSAYRVTWRVDVEADGPLDAAKAARTVLLGPDTIGFESVEIGRLVGEEYVPEGYVLTFPGTERPQARIEDENVCCGHCGSSDVRYLEDIGQHGRFFVRDGIAWVDGSSLIADDDGNDPRVWCVDCSEESDLPEPFQFA